MVAVSLKKKKSKEKAKELRAERDRKYKNDKKFVEGAAGYTKYRGDLADVMADFENGLRSAMSYSGAMNIEEFHQKAKFTLLTQNGVFENGAHGIISS